MFFLPISSYFSNLIVRRICGALSILWKIRSSGEHLLAERQKFLPPAFSHFSLLKFALIKAMPSTLERRIITQRHNRGSLGNGHSHSSSLHRRARNWQEINPAGVRLRLLIFRSPQCGPVGRGLTWWASTRSDAKPKTEKCQGEVAISGLFDTYNRFGASRNSPADNNRNKLFRRMRENVIWIDTHRVVLKALESIKDYNRWTYNVFRKIP